MGVNVWNLRLKLFYENKDFILQFTASVTGVGLAAKEVILLFGQMVVNVWNLRLRRFYENKDFNFRVGAQILNILHSRILMLQITFFHPEGQACLCDNIKNLNFGLQ
jgi:hypothetical protein